MSVPALTPDEWNAGRYVSEDVTVSLRGAALDGSPRIDVQVRAFPIGSGVMGEPRDCHALAACALYGQPFGFTRADVEACAFFGEITLWNSSESIEVPADIVKRLASLADRIEALLPPEP